MEKLDANYDFSVDPNGRLPVPPSNPLAVVALVLAIVALPLSILPIVGLFTAICALILGIVAHVKARNRKGAGMGVSIGAIVVSALALLLSLLVTACTVSLATSVNEGFKNQGIDLRELRQALSPSGMSAEQVAALRRQLKDEAEKLSQFNEQAPQAQGNVFRVEEIHRRIDNASAGELLLMRRLMDKVHIDGEALGAEDRKKLTALFNLPLLSRSTDEGEAERAPAQEMEALEQ